MFEPVLYLNIFLSATLKGGYKCQWSLQMVNTNGQYKWSFVVVVVDHTTFTSYLQVLFSLLFLNQCPYWFYAKRKKKQQKFLSTFVFYFVYKMLIIMIMIITHTDKTWTRLRMKFIHSFHSFHFCSFKWYSSELISD